MPTSPLVLQWQGQLFQICKWLSVDSLYHGMNVWKTSQTLHQNCRGSTCSATKTIFVLAAAQRAGSTSLFNTSKLKIRSETLAESFTKFEDVKLYLCDSISPCKIMSAPFAGLKMPCSQHCGIERKPRTDAHQIRLTFTYICYHASQRLT